MRHVPAVSILVLTLVLASSAHADEAPDTPAPPTPQLAPADALRSRGTIVLDDVIGGSPIGGLSVTLGWVTVQSQTNEGSGTHTRATLIAVQPSADVFILDGLSVGGMIGVSSSTLKASSTPGAGGMPDTDTTTTSRTIAPRIGYAFRLTDSLVLWPRVHFGFGTTTTTFADTPSIVATSTPEGSGETWSVGGDASMLFVLGRHAAIAAGPVIAYSFAKVDEPRTVSTSLDVGLRGALRLVF